MSKYEVGDKATIEILGKSMTEYIVEDYTRKRIYFDTKSLDGISEPLHTYTEPLEAKIRRQAAEITRLLEENERLKPNYENIRAKGQNEAWELAQKIFRGAYDNGYSPKELAQIFGCEVSKPCIVENTYPEAAAKVEAWEKAKEEIKVGDVLEGIYDNEVKCIVTNLCPDNMAYLVFDDGTAGVYELDNLKKTGRHIDIDSFLKQIGEEK